MRNRTPWRTDSSVITMSRWRVSLGAAGDRRVGFRVSGYTRHHTIDCSGITLENVPHVSANVAQLIHYGVIFLVLSCTILSKSVSCDM